MSFVNINIFIAGGLAALMRDNSPGILCEPMDLQNSPVIDGVGAAMRVLNASGCDAQMHRINDYDDVLGLQRFLESDKNLTGEAFLNLGPPAIIVDNPVELGQSNDSSAGIIPYMGMTENWEKVVLAGGFDEDILSISTRLYW